MFIHNDFVFDFRQTKSIWVAVNLLWLLQSVDVTIVFVVVAGAVAAVATVVATTATLTPSPPMISAAGVAFHDGGDVECIYGAQCTMGWELLKCSVANDAPSLQVRWLFHFESCRCCHSCCCRHSNTPTTLTPMPQCRRWWSYRSCQHCCPRKLSSFLMTPAANKNRGKAAATQNSLTRKHSHNHWYAFPKHTVNGLIDTGRWVFVAPFSA